MNEKKKSLLDYVTSFFSFKPKKLVADNVVDEEKNDGRGQKSESYSTDKIQRRKSILNVSEELNIPKKGKKTGAELTYSQLIQRDKKLILNNRLLTVIAGLLVVKVVFFSTTEVIAIPPDMTEEVSVAGAKASESYKTQWGLFIATTLGNINPKNVTFVTNYILKMFPAAKQSDLEAELKKASDLMLARKVDQTFIPEDVNFLPGDNVLYVWGTRKTKFLNVSDKEQSERWTYEMVLSVKSGRPRILYLNQYSGTPNIKKVTVNGKVLEKEFTENTDMIQPQDEAEAQ
ncbi:MULTISPECIES: TraE/TraK family type IV conjugative transfer system protein [Enterobacteriaceae]|uniref:Uncharacterized protein n=2 Tax=Enterobacteriaceae TaxID=543 RepID=A0A6G6APS7_KLEPN|nr:MULTISPECIES: TraE/TraK family type IV conjugative transfer system protein [Enterobacteriaceae]MDM9661348.1 TraE/TraK family type IV conjugative transfer system protein [Raoultella planticola]KAB8131340.1 conjugal transfer protein TraE [Raoultella ornithinolytica]MBC4620609.1 conjugal transfer protein TraE [Klebsiella pneumoniae]MBK0678618.1 conjugal transfer protein TraE [Klebsiella oxytoca]MBN7912782.1 conjugal transfer protein TraE [Klebsiella pneumoniae]